MLNEEGVRAASDAAAQLFWRLAEQNGIGATAGNVVETNGDVLFRQPFTRAVLAEYGLDSATPQQQRAFLGAVAKEAVSACREEKNMNGIIYAEDLPGGRSPAAQAVDTRPVLHAPRHVEMRGSIDTLGRLCLRHPLPAVVSTNRPPRSSFVAVADTVTALGRQVPLFLGAEGVQQVNHDMFILTGVFHIPVPSPAVGDLWGGVIQNSSRFVTRMGGQTDTGAFDISVTW